MINWEGYEKNKLWPNKGNATAFTWLYRGKPRKLSVRITGTLDEIRTELITSTESYI
jgi:hypothetical protein